MNVFKKILRNRILTNLILIFLLILIFSYSNEYFFTFSNFRNIIFQSAITIMVSFAMTFILITGGIDLSIGSVVALSSVIGVLAMNSGFSIFTGILITIAVSMLFGLLHGVLVAKTKLSPFIITLATLNIARGMAYLITDGATLPFSDPAYLNFFGGRLFGLPIPAYIVILFLLISSFILRRLKIGREIYAVGSNKQAARLSGIDVSKTYIFTYVIAGFLIGVASLFVIGRVSSGIPSYGTGLELDAIVASVIGGTSMEGGKGSHLGTVIGATLVVVLINGLTILGISSYIQMMVQGLIVLVAVYWDTLDFD